jgi:predicted metallopeptidase
LRRSGFDFTQHIATLVSDVVLRVPELGHVDTDRIAFSFSQARKRVLHGLQASLTPLRFEGGARQGVYHGRKMAVQQLLAPSGEEMLYILTFYLPRFLDLSFDEKLLTVFHELWHISERCDGDLRRHAGRCYAHSHSQAEYDAQLVPLVDAYLATCRDEPLVGFLRLNFEQLKSRYGSVYGVRLARPKLIPISA